MAILSMGPGWNENDYFKTLGRLADERDQLIPWYDPTKKLTKHLMGALAKRAVSGRATGAEIWRMFTDEFAIASAARISRHAAGAALWCRRNHNPDALYLGGPQALKFGGCSPTDSPSRAPRESVATLPARHFGAAATARAAASPAQTGRPRSLIRSVKRALGASRHFFTSN